MLLFVAYITANKHSLTFPFSSLNVEYRSEAPCTLKCPLIKISTGLLLLPTYRSMVTEP